MKKHLFLLFGMLFLAQITVIAGNAPFPLTKGNFWIYEGIVKYQTGGPQKATTQKVSLKMEVTEVYQRAQVTIAVVKGFPTDLINYEDSIKRNNYLIVSVNNRRYYLIRPERCDSVLAKVKNQKAELIDIVKEDELFLDFPLHKGEVFGETAMLTREDGYYSWKVSESSKKDTFHISYKSSPASISFDFVPGKGITRYNYIHHGTISECNIKLIRFFHQ